MAKTPAKAHSEGLAARLDRASNAALAAAPGDDDDDAETWAVKAARRRAVFHAEYGRSTPNNAAPPASADGLQQGIESNSEALAKCEELLGLTAPNPQFRRLLCDAVTLCVELQCHPRSQDRVVRKGLIRVSNAAKTASKDLLALDRALNDLAPQYSNSLLAPHFAHLLVVGEPNAGQVRKLLYDRAARRNLDPAMLRAQAAVFDELSAMAARHVNLRKRIGEGAPKMVAFSALVAGLAQAFRIATGRNAKVTWHQYRSRYEGPFLALVEAVLPLAQSLTEHLGAPLRYPPTLLARGKYVHKQTCTPRKKRALS
jgi:hypothetical protein